MATDRPNLIFMNVHAVTFKDGSEYRIVEYRKPGAQPKTFGQTRADRSQRWGEATPLGLAF